MNRSKHFFVDWDCSEWRTNARQKWTAGCMNVVHVLTDCSSESSHLLSEVDVSDGAIRWCEGGRLPHENNLPKLNWNKTSRIHIFRLCCCYVRKYGTALLSVDSVLWHWLIWSLSVVARVYTAICNIRLILHFASEILKYRLNAYRRRDHSVRSNTSRPHPTGHHLWEG